ncbi:MAG: hypothetical protein EAX89_14865 [Candidatus Lokiarchaeota archaeon]|nr:hypothetical protein [Candidatus Lokiarchaeota archaeon]
MNTDEFRTKLEEVQDLMRQEKYKKALYLLEELKEIEQTGDFDYSLTHKLYQLISNSKSLYNQQKILNLITQISQKEDSVSLVDLNQKLKEQENLDIELSILKREIEILILRSLLKCQIDGDTLIFY